MTEKRCEFDTYTIILEQISNLKLLICLEKKTSISQERIYYLLHAY